MAFGLSAAAVGLIGAGAGLVGSVVSADGARHAANTQADSAAAANQLSADQFAQNRADMAPWRNAGQAALGQLNAGTVPGGDFNRDFSLADFQKDPGYQFRMDQGSNALQSSAAARGGLMNGGTLKALDRYGQDYASGEYTNAYNRFNADRTQRFNRLSGIAGTGQTATRDVGLQGTNLATQNGNNLMQAANARASGYVGQGNAINGGLSTLGNWWQSQNGSGSSYGNGQGMNYQPNGYNPAQAQSSETIGGLFGPGGYGG